MAKKMKKEDARLLLGDVNPDTQFFTSDGTVVKNIIELKGLMENIDAETFSHHVNKEKNDFKNWVADVVGDKKLANDFTRAKTAKTYMKKIDKRIQALRKIAKG